MQYQSINTVSIDQIDRIKTIPDSTASIRILLDGKLAKGYCAFAFATSSSVVAYKYLIFFFIVTPNRKSLNSHDALDILNSHNM